MEKDKDMEISLSESSVSLQLELIQRRCSQLVNEPSGLSELKLEDAVSDGPDANDPYNRHNP